MQPLRVARYLRVSRHDQDTAMQADETAAFAKARGWKLVETYRDHGISGAKETRPALDKLLADARKRKFDALIVYKADRLFRSLRHMVLTLDEFTALGIAFVSTTEPFDTSTPSGKLLLHIVSAMAEFERSLLIERVKSGVGAARRRGARLGRPKARLDMDRLRDLRAQGLSVRKIAETLNVGSSTVQRHLGGALRNP
jgi:DNA invertase Pin-like site-specific DNA recombinase